MYRLYGLQRMPLRPFFAPDDSGGSGGGTPPAGDPPTLPAPPDPNAAPPASAPASPASAGTPAGTPARTRKPRAPKAPTTAAPKDEIVNIIPKGGTVVDKLEDLPTPGGLVLLLVIIAIFLFAIVPVSGKRTRLRLLWDTVRGKTSLPEPTGAPATNGGGTSGGFAAEGGAQLSAPMGTATGTGSPIAPGLTAAAASMSGPVMTSGYTDFDMPYPDAWQEASYAQGYPGETVYTDPTFSEYGP